MAVIAFYSLPKLYFPRLQAAISKFLGFAIQGTPQKNPKTIEQATVAVRKIPQVIGFPWISRARRLGDVQSRLILPTSWFLMTHWLEVDKIPLKNNRKPIGMMTFPRYGKIKFMFQTTNQISYKIPLNHNFPMVYLWVFRQTLTDPVLQSPWH